jgi:hypothetical protein
MNGIDPRFPNRPEKITTQTAMGKTAEIPVVERLMEWWTPYLPVTFALVPDGKGNYDSGFYLIIDRDRYTEAYGVLRFINDTIKNPDVTGEELMNCAVILQELKEGFPARENPNAKIQKEIREIKMAYPKLPKINPDTVSVAVKQEANTWIDKKIYDMRLTNPHSEKKES